MKKISLLLLIIMSALAFQASPAFAGTAYRAWSDGTAQESKYFPDTDKQAAFYWIQGKAKGDFINVNGNTLFVVLRDTWIDQWNSQKWRGPNQPYYNLNDPYNYSRAIQYTLNLLPNYPNLVEDNVYGANTTSVVKTFESRNGSTINGIMEDKSYKMMSIAIY